ncbi:MAG: hypothetical protein J1E31_02720 [Helicobacter sp.]|nr:hypothetical protein [Helicobacter sp.]
MVKKIFLLFLFASSLLAEAVDYKVMSLLGGQDYKANQKFIQRLFSNTKAYLNKEGEPDLYKISQTLKSNGLLQLSFSSPKELEISFSIEGDPAIFMNALYDSLQAMGYYYFIAKQSLLEDSQYKFILSMNTEYAIDPVLLQEKLRDYGYEIVNIERQALTQWVYDIKEKNFQYPKAILLKNNNKSENANLNGEYWYQITQGSSLEIASKLGELWYPKVIFFDSKLKVIEVSSYEKPTKQISLRIPKTTSYIKISDVFLPASIKNGIAVTLK